MIEFYVILWIMIFLMSIFLTREVGLEHMSNEYILISIALLIVIVILLYSAGIKPQSKFPTMNELNTADYILVILTLIFTIWISWFDIKKVNKEKQKSGAGRNRR